MYSTEVSESLVFPLNIWKIIARFLLPEEKIYLSSLNSQFKETFSNQISFTLQDPQFVLSSNWLNCPDRIKYFQHLKNVKKLVIDSRCYNLSSNDLQHLFKKCNFAQSIMIEDKDYCGMRKVPHNNIFLPSPAFYEARFSSQIKYQYLDKLVIKGPHILYWIHILNNINLTSLKKLRLLFPAVYTVYSSKELLNFPKALFSIRKLLLNMKSLESLTVSIELSTDVNLELFKSCLCKFEKFSNIKYVNFITETPKTLFKCIYNFVLSNLKTIEYPHKRNQGLEPLLSKPFLNEFMKISTILNDIGHDTKMVLDAAEQKFVQFMNQSDNLPATLKEESEQDDRLDKLWNQINILSNRFKNIFTFKISGRVEYSQDLINLSIFFPNCRFVAKNALVNIKNFIEQKPFFDIIYQHIENLELVGIIDLSSAKSIFSTIIEQSKACNMSQVESVAIIDFMPAIAHLYASLLKTWKIGPYSNQKNMNNSHSMKFMKLNIKKYIKSAVSDKKFVKSNIRSLISYLMPLMLELQISPNMKNLNFYISEDFNIKTLTIDSPYLMTSESSLTKMSFIYDWSEENNTTPCTVTLKSLIEMQWLLTGLFKPKEGKPPSIQVGNLLIEPSLTSLFLNTFAWDNFEIAHDIGEHYVTILFETSFRHLKLCEFIHRQRKTLGVVKVKSFLPLDIQFCSNQKIEIFFSTLKSIIIKALADVECFTYDVSIDINPNFYIDLPISNVYIPLREETVHSTEEEQITNNESTSTKLQSLSPSFESQYFINQQQQKNLLLDSINRYNVRLESKSDFTKALADLGVEPSAMDEELPIIKTIHHFTTLHKFSSSSESDIESGHISTLETTNKESREQQYETDIKRIGPQMDLDLFKQFLSEMRKKNPVEYVFYKPPESLESHELIQKDTTAKTRYNIKEADDWMANLSKIQKSLYNTKLPPLEPFIYDIYNAYKEQNFILPPKYHGGIMTIKIQKIK